MERLCIRVQQQLCVPKSCEDGDEVQTARQILKEARNSRAVSERCVRVCGCVYVRKAQTLANWAYCCKWELQELFPLDFVLLTHFSARLSKS